MIIKINRTAKWRNRPEIQASLILSNYFCSGVALILDQMLWLALHIFFDSNEMKFCPLNLAWNWLTLPWHNRPFRDFRKCPLPSPNKCSQLSESTQMSPWNKTKSVLLNWNRWNGSDKCCPPLPSPLPSVQTSHSWKRETSAIVFVVGKTQILIRRWIISCAAWLRISTLASEKSPELSDTASLIGSSGIISPQYKQPQAASSSSPPFQFSPPL